ncbi:L-selectin-like [Anthonomus grandis grandis]|uniref:L-selectin-like n=1 Tax=Anthonomus grandis grandis TaxID=2921223 RepID=UPI00216626B9|nr:L-selectin-like [Anthonomus grandis grandis]
MQKTLLLENLDEEDWLGARNFCRMRCMDTVSLETKVENEWIKYIIRTDNITEIWTSGRKCDFQGCDREDLQPLEINGWFWSAVFQKLAPTIERENNDWSYTGGDGVQQPDNRESANGKEENCIAIVNNRYGDGIHWHDEVCATRKPFVCEDSAELLRYARYIRPELNIK